MDAEEPCTCFPVWVREEGEGPITFLPAWLSKEPGTGDSSFYFQSLHFSSLDVGVDPYNDPFGVEALDSGFTDGSLKLLSDRVRTSAPSRAGSSLLSK